MQERDMPHNRHSTKRSTASLLAGIIALSFVLGGLGAWCGTGLIMLMNNGACIEGPEAGYALLLVSAVLAVPGVLLLRSAVRAW